MEIVSQKVFYRFSARQVAGMMLHCAIILATCLATATAENSREPFECFNWLMRTIRCEAIYVIYCEGCYIRQCVEKSLQHYRNL